MNNNNNGNSNGGAAMVPYNGPGTEVMSPIAYGSGLPQGQRRGSSVVYEATVRNPAGNALALPNNLSTEALLGEGCIDMQHYMCDKSRTLPGYMSYDKGILARSIDYPTVGVIGQMRAAVEDMFARGRQLPDVTIMTVTGTTFNAAFADNVAPAPVTTFFPRSLGFVVDWGVSMINFAPFDMPITTVNWVGDDLQPLNRSMTLRVTRPSGSSIFIPWAQRISPTMAFAQPQLARPAGNGEADTGLITIGPLPATIATSFSASISFMTAFVPTTAAFAAMLSLYGNKIGDIMLDPNGNPMYGPQSGPSNG